MANISQKWLNDVEPAVLYVFANDYSKKMYGSEIARRLNMPQRTVSRKLNNLCDSGILAYNREGRNKLYYLNHDNPSVFQFLIFAETYKSLRFFAHNPRIALILAELPAAVIFGSYAKGTWNESSDLDILFFSEEDNHIEKAIGNFPVQVHAHYLLPHELEMKLKAKNALALEIAENHILSGKFDEIVRIFMGHFYG